ncbi:MAG: hypothetical protein QOE65_1916 [Solirubrobacteraceae bacterium]|jgi:hypothetical protein|nr:hypothetical protein [Solirubrobacteraceae bacterium]
MRRAPVVLLALLSLGLAVALAVVLLGDDDEGEGAGAARAPATRTVAGPPPALRGGQALRRRAVLPLALRRRGVTRRRAAVAVAGKADAPGEPLFIAVTVEGQTGEWNGQSRAYLASSSFKRSGVLIVQPDGNFGLLAGGLAETTAGRIAFVTNSSVFRWVRGISPVVWQAAVPVATVTVDPAQATLQAVLGPRASTVVNNNFNVRPGLVSPRTITQGRAQLRFTDGHVDGQFELYGGGFIEPGNSFPVDVYRATVHR